MMDAYIKKAQDGNSSFEIFTLKVISESPNCLDATLFLGSNDDKVIERMRSPEWIPVLALYVDGETSIFLVNEKLYKITKSWRKHGTLNDKDVKMVPMEYSEVLHNIMLKRYLDWQNEYSKRKSFDPE